MTVLNKDKILEAAKDFVTQGKLDKAIREFEKIAAVDPKDMRVKLQIAELFVKRRQIPEAIKSYREVAESYTHDGFFLKAVTVYKNILRLNPSMLDVNQALAGLYEKMGLAKDAIHQYEILAVALEHKNQYDEALKLREKLVELAPDSPLHRVRLAEAYQRDSRKEDSLVQYEILAKQYRERKEEPKKMIELFERILPHRPENQAMLSELVHLYYSAKDFRAAIKWIENRKALVAKDPDLMELAGQMYSSLNQLESARAKYQELAEFYIAQGKVPEALKAYAEIVVILPEESETVKKLAEAVQPGCFEALLQQANERRGKREEESRAKEAAMEKEKEAKEQERKAAKDGKPAAPPPPKPAAPAAPAAPAKPVTPPAPAAPKITDPEIAASLKIAKAAISLAQAYQSTGLNDEAKQEFEHARTALQKILTALPQHKEAGELFRQLPK